MENKPVKRSPYIVKLSRDHHAGLLFCWKIRQGKRYLVESARMKKYVAYFYSENLLPHFKEEENYLFAPALDDQQVQQAMKDHARIKELAASIASSEGDDLNDLLTHMADTVDQHIRFEERTLFPHLEELLPEKVLKEICEKLDHPPEKDTYADEFWLKPSADQC